MTEPIPDRVARRAYNSWVEDENGCYISTYSVASHGYAQIGWWADGKSHGTTAHRAAWTHANGQIPDGLTIDHKLTCDHRCVNTNHLRLLTLSQNCRRNFSDFPLDAGCVRGHDHSERIRKKRGEWICRLCKNEDQRVAYWRRKEAS